MFKLKEKAKVTVGLDIGNSSVKVVQLQAISGVGQRELLSFDIKPIKNQERSSIVQAIKEVLETAQINTKVVNTSVSGQSVIVRYIQLPKMTKEELINALKFEAAKYIPFSINEVIYDCQILEDGTKQDKMRILLVAAKKEVIEERMQLLKEASLSPSIIDVDCFAIINSFKLVSQENKGVIAVLDIGADMTSINILRDNIPYFNRDLNIGGNDLTKSIIKEFEIKPEDAEGFKHNPQERYGELINTIKPVLDNLCREIHLSFNFCESQLGVTVHKIFLTGGTAKFKGIDKILNSILGIDVEIWDPTQILQINPALPKERLSAVGPLLTVCVGLALRG